jgi:hypothetical protein
MDPIDATQLPELAAPIWFIQFFKILGFTLHSIPMSLWYAGAALAVASYAFGGEHARRFGSRLMRQMPFIVAVGINFGIVPLLFLQLSYCRVFYPATVLMAWFWLAIIAMLIPAYYGVYLYAFGLAASPATIDPLRLVKRAAGWIAVVLFLLIGFIFANGMSLTTNLPAWPELMARHSINGAATGLAMNHADPTLWPRWLLMFGLAMLTTAAWIVVDAAWWAGNESAEYRRWVKQFAFKLAAFGAAWASAAGAWYVFGTWSADVSSAMFALPTIALTALTAVAPWLTVAVIWLWRNGDANRIQATAIGIVQVGVMAINGISRQVVQNLELKLRGGFDVTAQPVHTDFGPMALFLVTFVLGAAVVGWMLVQLVKASGRPTPAEPLA